ncbi:uncharacterized protein [Atheta coriaria]|uniref:uncharacterized protein n=1 Tax=Dalotia coriaria TaxID=877792 RepID=UPI0031F35B57
MNLTTARDALDDSTVCELHVPLKANINLTALGDIKVGDLQGDGVRVFSEMGCVTLGNLKCSEVSAGTNDKDIVVEGNIEATRVDLLCRQSGSIKAQKIKSLGLKLDTNEGNIHMNACYSKNGYFITKTGNIDLKNVHNRCRIDTIKNGQVKMVGFEGALEVSLQNGKADLQIQKLFDNSDITVREEGEITLRIPKELLDYVEILIWSKGCYVDDDIPYTEDDLKDLTTIRKAGTTAEHVLRVRCMKATCNVHFASWIDMMTQNMAKSTDDQSLKKQAN